MGQIYRINQPEKHRNRVLNLLFPLLLLGVTSCSPSNTKQVENASESVSRQESINVKSTSANKVKIITTFLPIYWFTKAVAGEVADVEVLVPPGTEVHDYQTTPENVKTLATANILVKNGLGLEEFLTDTIKSAENPQLQEINASKGIKPLDSPAPVNKIKIGNHDHGEHDHHKDHDGGKHHHHEEGNPHVWLDPILAVQQVNNIRDGLIIADPQNKNIYQANAAAYVQKLENLNDEFKQNLQKYPNCTFITFHDAYPYLAKRYNLKQVAIVELPEDQLSPVELQKAVNTVKKYQVKALFGESGVDNKLLNNLSQDLNLTLYPLDPLESGDKNPRYYFQGMQANLKNLVSGCK